MNSNQDFAQWILKANINVNVVPKQNEGQARILQTQTSMRKKQSKVELIEFSEGGPSEKKTWDGSFVADLY